MNQNTFTEIFSIAGLIKGHIQLQIIFLPITVLLVFFLTIMGGAGDRMRFGPALGTSAAFIYLIPAGMVILHAIVSKLFIVQIGAKSPVTFFLTLAVVLSLLVTAIILVIFGNIFLDNLYQIRQGNYLISLQAGLGIILFLVVNYLAALIPLPWVSAKLDRFF